jgi:hypothetical protein
VAALEEFGEHQAVHQAPTHRPSHDRNMRMLGSPVGMIMVVPVMITVSVIMVIVVLTLGMSVVVGPDSAGGSELDFDALHFGGHCDDQGANVTADVEQDRPLPGVGILCSRHQRSSDRSGTALGR